MTQSNFCTIREFAQYFAVSYQTAFNWVKQGKLKAVKVGKTIRIPSSEMQAFIERNAE